ncbi:MAG: 50S ribosomal protein L15 [Myxococcales bacterium]|nr:50S ribosomal protein L15 [Myxococcales bacterium]MCB9519902.1 50S ribosomal protein L15 [Myxococcales bacterium]MCB9533191.1 50S ribosomal protein L15 [Myxococcales bacterium]
MGLHDLHPSPGSTRTPKRKGRGPGSGNGKTGGRGHKGSKARSGGQTARGFEGGQMPLYRRLPKRGFRNDRFETRYTVVNLRDLAGLSGVIDLDSLVAAGRVSADPFSAGLKVLANGDAAPVTIRAAKFSQAAAAKIAAAGGTAEVI